MTAKDFITSLPEKVNAEALAGMETVFFFDITGDGGGQFTVKVADGDLQVLEGFHGEPKCEIKASSDKLVGVVSGDINPMMAVLMGQIKISNQGEMIKYAKIFGLM